MYFSKIIDKVIGVLVALILLGIVVLLGVLAAFFIKMAF